MLAAILVFSYLLTGAMFAWQWAHQFGPRTLTASLIEILLWPYGVYRYLRTL